MDIVLIQFPPLFGVQNPSPFCLKVETWLRLAGIDFSTRTTMSPQGAPRGKLPYVLLNGEPISDSSEIIATLGERLGCNLEAGLDPERRAVLHACSRMLEEHTYFALLWSRWVGPNWSLTRAALGEALPPVVRTLLPLLIHRQLKRDVRGQGMGRLSESEMISKASEDLAAVAKILGNHPFLGGETPVTADATLYGFSSNLLHQDQPSGLCDAIRAQAALVAHEARLRTWLEQGRDDSGSSRSS